MSTTDELLIALRQEIAKLDQPASVACRPDEVLRLSHALLQHEVYDLRVASYELWASLTVAPPAQWHDRIAAIASRLKAESRWEPPPERHRARQSIGRWLVTRVDQLASDAPPGAAAQQLDEALAQLSEALREHGCDEPGAWASVRARLAGRLRAEQRTPEAAVDTTSSAAAGAAEAREAMVARAPATTRSEAEPTSSEQAMLNVPPAAAREVVARTDAPLDLWAIGEGLLPHAIDHIGQDPDDSAAWQLYLTQLWLGVVSLPPSDGAKTRIVAAAATMLEPLEEAPLATFGEVLVALLAHQLPRHRLELRLCRRIAACLSKHGHTSAAQIVRLQARALCARLDGLDELVAQNEQPLCDAETRAWLDRPASTLAPERSRAAAAAFTQATAEAQAPYQLLCGQLAALAQLAHGTHTLAQSFVCKESAV